MTCLTCSDLKITCPSEAYDFRIPLILGTLYVQETSYKGSIIQPLIEPDNASLTTLQICITIPCGSTTLGVRFTLATSGLWLGDLIWLKAGQLQVLVATDVAARGLHVKHLLGNPGNINLTARDETGRPSEIEDCQDVWKVSFKKMVKDLDMCIKDPERTGSFSRVYWFVEGPLLFSCIFLCLGLRRNGINDGLPEKQIRQQCLWLCSLPTVEGLGGADCYNDFPQKSVLQWTLGLSWSFECFCFLLHYLIVNTHGRFSKLSPNYGHSLLQSEAVEEMELYIVDNDLGQKPELRIAISKNNVYLLKTFSLRFGQV